MYDILIKNGMIFDGRGGYPIRTDLAIKDGKIALLEDQISAAAEQTIDAEGLYVTPGFIDIQNHSDSHGLVLIKPELESLVAQGVTTAVIGQCGASLAPIINSESLKSLQKWGLLEGVNVDWKSHADFAHKMQRHTFGINIINFIGHATLRRSFTGDQPRSLNETESQQLAQLVGQSLKEGAFGLSLGLQYAHEVNTGLSEFIELARVLKSQNKILSVHLHSQSSALLDAVREVTELAKAEKVKLKISHFKVEGAENYPQLEPAIDTIEHAYQSGANIKFDVYPYVTSWYPLYIYLPRWAYEGGVESLLKRIRDKTLLPKIMTELEESRQRIKSLMVSSSPKMTKFVGRTIDQIASQQQIKPEEALIRVLTSNHGHAIVFDQDIDSDQLTRLIRHPFSLIASDGVGYPLTHNEKLDFPHPRCFGAFPRYLKFLKEENKNQSQGSLSWSEGIAKITGFPAEFLGLKRKGFIKKGFDADIVVFDPENIEDKATYNNPYQTSEGLKFVINNGKISLYDGQLSGVYAGKFLIS